MKTLVCFVHDATRRCGTLVLGLKHHASAARLIRSLHPRATEIWEDLEDEDTRNRRRGFPRPGMHPPVARRGCRCSLDGPLGPRRLSRRSLRSRVLRDPSRRRGRHSLRGSPVPLARPSFARARNLFPEEQHRSDCLSRPALRARRHAIHLCRQQHDVRAERRGELRAGEPHARARRVFRIPSWRRSST